jgi:hypothetical protein
MDSTIKLWWFQPEVADMVHNQAQEVYIDLTENFENFSEHVE